jgi:inorganic pyrophosphatase
MKIDDILSQEEKEILSAGNEIIKELSLKTNKPIKKIPKKMFTTQPLSVTPVGKVHHNFISMVNKANEYYRLLKAMMDHENSTHRFITQKAIELVGIKNSEKQTTLISACVEPDKNKSLYEIAFEGHFYGNIGNHQYGNFFHKVIKNKTAFFWINNLTKIDEHALGNFKKFVSTFKAKSNLQKLGWALHFIQDLTAPHHATNKAIFFETITDKTNSHFQFEKYSRSFVWDHGPLMLDRSRGLLSKLQSVFNPKKSSDFALEIHRRALVHADNINSFDLEKWNAVIEANIPLAIAASATILKHLLG